MKKSNKIMMTTVLVSALGLTALSASADYRERGYRGCNSDDYPMMMRGTKKGKGFMAERETPLTMEEAKTLVSARLIMKGNEHLKVGQVTEKEDDKFLVQIVTKDNSLVREITIDRKTGMPSR